MNGLLKKLNIKPRQKKIYAKALTHSSYINEHEYFDEDFEKLEFMGDAVLQLFVSELIFKHRKIFDEGQMTLIRSKLVRTEALATVAKKINLGKFLRLGAGEEKSGGRERKNVLADSFEALVAAIYFDQGDKKTKKIISKLFIPMLDNLDFDDLIDYKTKLQELLISDKRQTIKYVELSKKGSPNNPTFEFGIFLDNNIKMATGKGKTKKQAQQQAAKNALNKRHKKEEKK